ncbi:metallophosphoesterase [Cellulomonas shaoxiangyii]|uniref:Metallophosphoesterase n=1 Tax=Cellulomonas shaoxiangyii TaxID=2566013 RepID=A0A4P7SG90_9CELL|nr:metallophosphoesterase [Cellulomonas shaoxiangyii]QCB92487.1 metallophosphoesterase [Cellulomonas shaoxiangyii]TGY84961.1 metallophosphoesterase [Cellulomonas shaoxiangyii]
MHPSLTALRPALRTVGGLALAGGAGVTWSLVEARWYALREVTVPVLPAGQAPLRVLHVSDLHLTPGQRRKVDWVRDLATLDPHLVVDTGDNWAHRDSMPALLRALEPLLALPGAFVLGSNDYVAPMPKNPARYLLPDARRAPARPPVELPWRELVARLTSAGWTDLSNRRDALEVDGRRLSLVGTDDAHLEQDRFPAAGGPDDARARSDRRDAPDIDLHVGVTHAPYRRVLDAMHADGVDLMIAGHTHGGQLTVPLWGALTTNCDLDTGRAKGLHGWPGARPDRAGGAGSAWLHVSAGLGTSPYAPVRFACRPEATLLTLVAA